MALTPQQINQLNAASARVAAGSGSETDRRNIEFATRRHSYSYTPSPAPVTPGAPAADPAIDPALAAQAGLSPSDLLSLQEQAQAPENLTERRSALRTEYRVPELEKLSFAAAPKTYTDIFTEAYNAAGLGDIKAKIADRDAQIAKKRNDLAAAEGKIGDNPWISEASRVGRVNKLYETAQKEINNLIDERNSLKSEYDNGVQRADLVAGKTLDSFTANRTLSQKQLEYYSGLAEQQLGDETAAQKATRTREALKILPAYLKAKVEAGTMEAPKTIETAQGIMMWDGKQGKYVSTGMAPYRAPSGGGSSSFWSDAAAQLAKLKSGTPWGLAFNALKAKYPGTTDSEIDAALGKDTWAQPGAYESYRASSRVPTQAENQAGVWQWLAGDGKDVPDEEKAQQIKEMGMNPETFGLYGY